MDGMGGGWEEPCSWRSPGTRGHGPKAPRPAALVPAALVPACCWAVGVRPLGCGREEHPEGRSHAAPATRGPPPLRGGAEPCAGKSRGPPLLAHTPCQGCSGTWAAPALSAPDNTLPAGQGRMVTTPTTPHSQQEGPPRGQGPPRESSCARGSNRDEGEAGSPGQSQPALSSVESFSVHSPPSKAKRPQDRGPDAGSGVHTSLSLGTAQPCLPLPLPTPRRGPGTARAHLEDRTGPGLSVRPAPAVFPTAPGPTCAWTGSPTL